MRIASAKGAVDLASVSLGIEPSNATDAMM